jgi:hypothetical protein
VEPELERAQPEMMDAPVLGGITEADFAKIRDHAIERTHERLHVFRLDPYLDVDRLLLPLDLVGQREIGLEKGASHRVRDVEADAEPRIRRDDRGRAEARVLEEKASHQIVLVPEAAAVPPTYFPHALSLDSYERLWNYQAGLPVYFLNSGGAALLTILFCLALTIPAGYALARLSGKWGQSVGVGIFLTYLVPPTLLFLPLSREASLQPRTLTLELGDSLEISLVFLTPVTGVARMTAFHLVQFVQAALNVSKPLVKPLSLLPVSCLEHVAVLLDHCIEVRKIEAVHLTPDTTLLVFV